MHILTNVSQISLLITHSVLLRTAPHHTAPNLYAHIQLCHISHVHTHKCTTDLSLYNTQCTDNTQFTYSSPRITKCTCNTQCTCSTQCTCPSPQITPWTCNTQSICPLPHINTHCTCEKYTEYMFIFTYLNIRNHTSHQYHVPYQYHIHHINMWVVSHTLLSGKGKDPGSIFFTHELG